MCGLVGVAGNLSAASIKIFEQALYCDQLRGKHSTGIAAVASNKQVVTYKRALPAADFLQLQQAQSLISCTKRALIGHNRYATAGAKTDDNAHPFTYGSVTMVHNGTLTTREGLSKDHRFTVDSEHIAYTLGNTSCEMEDICDVLEKLEGAYALVWFDERTGRLYMARNDERELSACFDGDEMFWASESSMLRWLVDRNYNCSTPDILSIPKGILFSFDVMTNTKGLDIYASRETREFTPAVTPPKWQGHGGVCHGGVYGRGGSYYRSSSKVTTLPYITKDSPVVTRLEDMYKGKTLEFMLDHWHIYCTGPHAHTHGMARGFLLEDPTVPIMCHNLAATDVEFASDGRFDNTQLYSGTIMHANLDKSSQKAVLVVGPSTVQLEGWDSLTEGDDGVYVVGNKQLSGISKERLDKLQQDGCCMCGNPIADGDLADAELVEKGEALVHGGTCAHNYSQLILSGE